MMTQGVGTVADEDHGAGETVEFDTYMRERPVHCRWCDGELTGDAELLARIEHMAVAPDWQRSPASVARAISAAVAHPVTIRVVLAADEDLGSSAPGPCDPVAPCDGADGGALGHTSMPSRTDVLGDYWLG